MAGAPQDPANLWPQLRFGEWSADRKDTLEAKLCRLACDGKVPLAEAQRERIAAYRKYIGAGSRKTATRKVPSNLGQSDAAVIIAGIELAHRIHKHPFSFGPGRPPSSKGAGPCEASSHSLMRRSAASDRSRHVPTAWSSESPKETPPYYTPQMHQNRECAPRSIHPGRSTGTRGVSLNPSRGGSSCR